MSLLWSTICLTDLSDIFQPPWCRLTALQPLALPKPRSFKFLFHLNHSGTTPLNLYLFFRDYDESSVVTCHVFQLIQPHLHCIQHFQIFDQIFDFKIPLSSFQFLKSEAPMLQSLDLYSKLGDPIPTEFLATSFLRLDTVTLHGTVGCLLSPWLLTLPHHWKLVPLIFPRLETLTKGCLTFLLPLINAPILEQFDISSSFLTQAGAHYQTMVGNIMDSWSSSLLM